MKLKIGRKKKFKDPGTLQLLDTIRRIFGEKQDGPRSLKIVMGNLEITQAGVDDAVKYINSSNDNLIISPANPQEFRIIFPRETPGNKS